MKHIYKKFLHEVNIPEGSVEALNKSDAVISWNEREKLKNLDKDLTAWVITEGDKMIKTFRFNYKGEILWIPEPDTVLIYFHNAYANLKSIKESKGSIVEKIKEMKYTEEVQIALYDFFGLTSGFVIFLFTAIEAFLNHNIPKNFVYKREDKRKTEHYNKEQIEKFIGIDEKLNKIFVEVFERDFRKNHPLKYKHIENLKEFRDSIIHTKANIGEDSAFDYLFKRSVNFKYEETMEAVKDFINFYKPNYIIDCPCSNNW